MDDRIFEVRMHLWSLFHQDGGLIDPVLSSGWSCQSLWLLTELYLSVFLKEYFPKFYIDNETFIGTSNECVIGLSLVWSVCPIHLTGVSPGYHLCDPCVPYIKRVYHRVITCMIRVSHTSNECLTKLSLVWSVCPIHQTIVSPGYHLYDPCVPYIFLA